MRGAALLVVLAACGRLNFDPLDDSTGDANGSGDAAFVCDTIPCGIGRSTAVLMCGDRCFATCNETADQPTAAQRCAAWGGTLAVIRSQADHDCLAQMIVNQTWIGYVQAPTATTPASDWSWVDGTAPTIANWDPIEPNDANGDEDGFEQCAEMYSNGQWNDETCSIASETFISCSH